MSENQYDYDEFPDEYLGMFTCEICGSERLEYQGEGYDEGEYLGSVYKCLECGHVNFSD